MYTHVVDLREFYDSRMGQVTRHVLRRAIRRMWPDVSGLEVLGLGYATPYLRQFRDEAARVFALMPAPQGVSHWPYDAPGAVALADELELPVADLSVDRVLLVHGVECTEHLRPMLREIWRVLAGNGRLLVVVPNRRGLWARLERTPLGHGHPYSTGQLSRLLRDNMFTPTRTGRALFIPPTRSGFLLRSAAAWERIGGSLFPTFAGVNLMEAGKQLYSVTPLGQTVRRSRTVVLPFPQAAHRVRTDEGPGPAVP
jgi:SAM-dependent methyltransferase